MKSNISFIHSTRGKGRPQIVLVGNGLEIRSGQRSWNELVDALKAPDCLSIGKQEREKLPFPLLYELLSSPASIPYPLTKEDIKKEETRLAKAMGKLQHESNPGLDFLPDLGADHIFTTNYSYCIEKAFFPSKNFLLSCTRSKARFNMNSKHGDGKNVREVNYRLHTGYLANNKDGSPVGIWHIHGECTVSQGVVLGHDRYGRLLSRIEALCDSQAYTARRDLPIQKSFTSWPELFLYGDIHIIGFGFDLSEFDLWWLLRRKQRERYADGRVYFYENGKNVEKSTRDLLLAAHGVLIETTNEMEDFDSFYKQTLQHIAARIKENKKY